MRRQKGFSLIELLIVVAIILIIAAIAIPNLMRSRIAANESAAVGNMRAINTAEVSFASTYPDAGYATTLAALGSGGASPCVPSKTSACLIDDSLAAAVDATHVKSGYFFTMAASDSVGYTLLGTYATASSGKKKFYTDSTGAIHYTDDASAPSVSSPTI